MKKNSIYLRFNPFSEIVAVPFLLNRIFKGQKIKELLNNKIEYARDQASRSKFTDIEKFEKNLEYQNLDNFFANHFRKLDESSYHFFDDKINYCLKQYLMESRKIWTSTNMVVLEENFLKGAEKTLLLYFILNVEAKKTRSFISLFSKKDYYFKFIKVMEDNGYLDENNDLEIPIIFFAGILNFLKNRGVIKKVNNIAIISDLKNDFNYQMSTASFSSGVPHPTSESEKVLFDKLAKEFMISY